MLLCEILGSHHCVINKRFGNDEVVCAEADPRVLTALNAVQTFPNHRCLYSSGRYLREPTELELVEIRFPSQRVGCCCDPRCFEPRVRDVDHELVGLVDAL